MRPKRGIGLFLLALSFLIPLNVAYFYYDFYEDIEFRHRKSFSCEDKESLLTLFKKNPRILSEPGMALHPPQIFSLALSSLLSDPFLAEGSRNPVLRC